MILVWLSLFVGFLLCASLLIPRETVRRYKAAPKDWQYYAAHVLFYSIPASSFFSDSVLRPSRMVVASLVFASGGALYIWAVRSNPYFLPNIEVPVMIISGGAYSWFSHPGYVAMAMMAAGTWLMIGHSLAVIPLALYALLLCWRARKETFLIYQ